MAPVPYPLVAIVGAPNVGKSTLFNRLVRRRRSIVTDEPGVTRDRIYGNVTDAPRPFRLVDTGGLTPKTAAPFAGEIETQARSALAEASLVLFLVDGRAGPTAVDLDVATMLRREAPRLLLVATKVDHDRAEEAIVELHALALGEPLAVSAEHGRGIGPLLDRIEELLRDVPDPPASEPDEVRRPLNLAIIGRPNAGKSSLLNRLAGEERAVVSAIPGTTRDSVDTLLELGDRRYRLIDTAGIRRRGKVRLRVERFSVSRARQNLAGCDVAILVLDAEAGFAAQDAHIAGHALEAFKPLVVAVNKWDRVEGREEQAKKWEETVRTRLKFAKSVPLVLISALTGQRAAKVLELADQVHAAGAIEVPTPAVNRLIQEINDRSGAGAPRLYYATQTGTHPPHFLVFCDNPDRIHFSLERRLTNLLRDRYGFGASPIRLEFRRRRPPRRR